MSDTRFRFLITGDPQIGSDRDLGCLARDVERHADRLRSAEFLVVLGDLTKNGTPAQIESYRRAVAPIWPKTFLTPHPQGHLETDGAESNFLSVPAR